ncbi:MAG: hypothetical protein ACRDM0_00340 [Thermoleophilaceae bacterium]
MGLVPPNVATLVSAPRPVRHEMRTFTEQEARGAPRGGGGGLEPLYVLAVSTGMRQDEILGLRWRVPTSTAGPSRCSRASSRVNL